MIAVNPKRTIALDRRLAAVHEAGHIVVARRYDLYPMLRGSVGRNPQGGKGAPGSGAFAFLAWIT